MDFSYVLITHNRRKRLLQTIDRLLELTPAPRDRWELFVVDNASTDGSPDAVSQRFGSQVELIRLEQNVGMPARNPAIRRATGRCVVLLDDDSYPLDGAVPRCVRYLDAHPKTAAVSGRVLLRDGRTEASAFPGVFIGCATVLRRAALEEVGLFDERFFRQAEEYELSFRLVAAGWRIERFEDLVFRHEKHLGGRPGDLAVRMDLRNNLLLTQRYLDEPARTIYREDWTQRYRALARHADQLDAAKAALDEFETMRQAEPHQPLDESAFEAMFGWRRQADQIADWAQHNRIRRVAIGDLGKNIHATWRACQQAGLEVSAIANRAPAFDGLNYRGVAVIDDVRALADRPDGIVLSNINPAQVAPRCQQLREQYDGPILTLWQRRDMPAEGLDPVRERWNDPLARLGSPHRTTLPFMASVHAAAAHAAGSPGRWPDFLGIGAQKAGTSWLSRNLDAHRAVHIPTGKEMHYFDWYFDRPPADYRSLFADAGKRVCGEITPGYSVLSAERIARVAELMPNVKLILLLRNPVERAWSQARMNLIKQTGRAFEQIDAQLFYDHFVSAHSRRRGDYPAMLDRWLNAFDPSQLFIGFYEQIINEPRKLIADVLRHIGVARPGGLRRLPLKQVVHGGPDVTIPTQYERFLRRLYADQIEQLIERFGDRVAHWRGGSSGT